MMLVHKEYGMQMGRFTDEHRATGWVEFPDLASAKAYLYGATDAALEKSVDSVKLEAHVAPRRGRPRKEVPVVQEVKDADDGNSTDAD